MTGHDQHWIGHTVVIGAGIAGLLAAHTLARFSRSVTIIDPRAGQPAPWPDQRDGHAHLLLAAGAFDLEVLHPGLLADLEGHGSPRVRSLQDVHISLRGRVLRTDPRRIDVPVVLPTLALLHQSLRERVERLPNLSLRPGTVVGLAVTDNRVRGVVMGADRPGGQRELIDADVVVDAAGRTSPVPGWLAARSGTPGPGMPQTHSPTVQYASQELDLAPGAVDEVLTVVGAHSRSGVGLILVRTERSWTFTCYGLPGSGFSATRQGMLSVAARLLPTPGYHAVRTATRLGPVRVDEVPVRAGSRPPAPTGLLAVGDTTAALNPVHAQGISVLARQVRELADLLDCQAPHAGRCDIAHLSTEHAARAQRIVDSARGRSVVADSELLPAGAQIGRVHRRADPRVVSRRYRDRVLDLSADDPEVAWRVLRVGSLLDSPRALREPSVLARAVGHRLGARRPG